METKRNSGSVNFFIRKSEELINLLDRDADLHMNTSLSVIIQSRCDAVNLRGTVTLQDFLDLMSAVQIAQKWSLITDESKIKQWALEIFPN